MSRDPVSWRGPASGPAGAAAADLRPGGRRPLPRSLGVAIAAIISLGVVASLSAGTFVDRHKTVLSLGLLACAVLLVVVVNTATHTWPWQTRQRAARPAPGGLQSGADYPALPSPLTPPPAGSEEAHHLAELRGTRLADDVLPRRT